MQKTTNESDLVKSLIWSNLEYNLAEFTDLYPLPQVVCVVDGYYSTEEEHCFGSNQVLALHEKTNTQKITGKDTMGRGIMFAIQYPGRVHVCALKYKVGKCRAKDLKSLYPKVGYVKIETLEMTDLIPVEEGDVLRIQKIDSKSKMVHLQKVSTKEDVVFSYSSEVTFIPLLDWKDYSISEVKQTFGFPTRVSFVKGGKYGRKTRSRCYGEVVLTKEITQSLVIATTVGDESTEKRCISLSVDLPLHFVVAEGFTKGDGNYEEIVRTLDTNYKETTLADFEQLNASQHLDAVRNYDPTTSNMTSLPSGLTRASRRSPEPTMKNAGEASLPRPRVPSRNSFCAEQGPGKETKQESRKSAEIQEIQSVFYEDVLETPKGGNVAIRRQGGECFDDTLNYVAMDVKEPNQYEDINVDYGLTDDTESYETPDIPLPNVTLTGITPQGIAPPGTTTPGITLPGITPSATQSHSRKMVTDVKDESSKRKQRLSQRPSFKIKSFLKTGKFKTTAEENHEDKKSQEDAKNTERQRGSLQMHPNESEQTALKNPFSSYPANTKASHDELGALSSKDVSPVIPESKQGTGRDILGEQMSLEVPTVPRRRRKAETTETNKDERMALVNTGSTIPECKLSHTMQDVLEQMSLEAPSVPRRRRKAETTETNQYEQMALRNTGSIIPECKTMHTMQDVLEQMSLENAGSNYPEVKGGTTQINQGVFQPMALGNAASNYPESKAKNLSPDQVVNTETAATQRNVTSANNVSNTKSSRSSRLSDDARRLLSDDKEDSYKRISSIPDDLSALTVSDLGHVLRCLNMACYVEVFEQEMIDGDILKDFNMDVLQSLNITLFHSKKLMKFINGWRPIR